MLPRIILLIGLSCDVFVLLQVLDQVKISCEIDRDMLIQVARTSLRTKVHNDLADLLTEVSGHIVASG